MCVCVFSKASTINCVTLVANSITVSHSHTRKHTHTNNNNNHNNNNGLQYLAHIFL